jgi:tetratricopeptide (TPR) repeat protein
MSTSTIEILRGELERLFSLDEMTSMSQRLLGLDPVEVGGSSAKASFARALTERCMDGDRIEALVDVLLVSKREVDPRVRDIAGLLAKDELVIGTEIGGFRVQKKIGQSDLGTVYLALLGEKQFALKVLRAEAARDRRAVHRFLTANRLVATVEHPGLPKALTAGELEDGTYFVAYEFVDAQPLSQRFSRTGPLHMSELKPLFQGILEPLAALHKANLVHGDIKLENILVSRSTGPGDVQHVTLIDFGTDRLRQRSVAANGHTGLLAVFGSPKTVAPELIRGRAADTRSDVYAFGAVVYELLSGKAVFHQAENATDAAFAHLSKEPEPPSNKAPRGWIAKDVDQFVLSLLSKDPGRRPKDAMALLESLEAIGRPSGAMRVGKAIAPEKVDNLIDMLIAAPDDSEAAMGLEKAVDEGADPQKVAEAFLAASEQVAVPTARERAEGLEDAPPVDDDAQETKKSLLFRAARIFDTQAKNKEMAEKAYVEILEVDPGDEIARVALEEVRKALGKYEEIVEMLVQRSELAVPGEERARIMAEIGHLYANELEDADQALVAYTRALCESPTDDGYAAEIERLAGARHERWTETLDAATEVLKTELLSIEQRSALLARVGRWYDSKVARADLALMAYQQILASDPANEQATEGLTVIYRRAQQWPELAAILLSRADATVSHPRERELRAEAAELFETKLNDVNRARDLYQAVVADDPGHVRAGEALGRIAEKTGDFQTLAKVLERRAEAKRGAEKAELLTKLAEVFEDSLNDLPEATRRYEAALAIEPVNLVALKGLDRIYNRTGQYRELLETLERQVAMAATPRQKINLFERLAALHDEEFLDHAAAARAFESILEIDPSHDGALTAIVRHYRALDRWEDAVRLYQKHIGVTTDEPRKVELLIAQARTLAEQIGSPERATRIYETVLERSAGHPAALEALAHLREVAGDSHAALSAIEALALKAATPEAKAEQWSRAARLLDARGDKDGAIERYKNALDANPKDVGASAALRKAYEHRGDALSVVMLIEKEIGYAEGDLAKARLFAELAKVQMTRLEDTQKAELNAKRAIDLDGTNADALMVLGDMAYAAGRYLEASKHYDTLVGRAQVFPREDAIRIVVQFMESLGRTSNSILPPPSAAAMNDANGPQSSRGSKPPEIPAINHPRMSAAVEALQKLAPEEPESLARAAQVVFDHGDPKAAHKMYEELLAKHGRDMAVTARADALYRFGEAARKSGDVEGAMKPLRDAADLDPANPMPLRALARVYEDKGLFEEVVRTKRQRLEVASGQERFELLLEIAEVEFQKLGDKSRAQKTYAAALEERPDDRKLLTKLMQLYSEEKDWAKLVEVVTRLADFVEDPKQRAKYMHTAAIVSQKQIGDVDQAISYYEKALEYDEGLTRALEELVELKSGKGDHDAVEKLLNVQLEHAKTAEDRERIPQILDRMADIYRKFLNEPEMAIDAYEAAHAFDPENRERMDTLAELYASDVTQYLDKAVRAQATILKRNPYRVESYKLLRRLFTEAKRADSAWCLCQALSVLNLAEPDEERFFKRHRADNAAPAQTPMGEDEWSRLTHQDTDPLLTRIFAIIQPTIIRARTQPVEAMGYDPRYAIDTSLHPYPVSQTLHYVKGALGMAAPLVFQNTNDPSALGFLHAHTPAIVIGRAAFAGSVPTQSMAFVAGRHMTYFRPGFYVRHLVPTGTGLKAWLFAAIKMSVPHFPVTPDLQGQVAEAMAAMVPDFQGVQREMLASAVSKLLQAGSQLDLKKWVASIDLTADRAGFLLAHDLQLATEVIRATEDAASIPTKERMKEIVLFSVSEDYFAIREKLGISVDS